MAVEALAAFEQYLEVVPDQSDVILHVAELLERSERFDDALSRYETWLGLHGPNVGVLFRVSECYLALGHSDSAILGYQRILQVDSEFAPALDRLRELTAGRPVSTS